MTSVAKWVWSRADGNTRQIQITATDRDKETVVNTIDILHGLCPIMAPKMASWNSQATAKKEGDRPDLTFEAIRIRQTKLRAVR